MGLLQPHGRHRRRHGQLGLRADRDGGADEPSVPFVPCTARWRPVGADGLEHLDLRRRRRTASPSDSVVIGDRGGAPYGVHYTGSSATPAGAVLRLDLDTTDGRTLHLARRRQRRTGAPTAMRGMIAAFDGCIDIDLAGSPFTNTLPIRRAGPARQAAGPRELRMAVRAVRYVRAGRRWADVTAALTQDCALSLRGGRPELRRRPARRRRRPRDSTIPTLFDRHRRSERDLDHDCLPHPRRHRRPEGQARPRPRRPQRADGRRQGRRRHPHPRRRADHQRRSPTRAARRSCSPISAGPRTGRTPKFSLQPVVPARRRGARQPVAFAEDCIGADRRGGGRGDEGRRRAGSREHPLPQGRGEERSALRRGARQARRHLRQRRLLRRAPRPRLDRGPRPPAAGLCRPRHAGRDRGARGGARRSASGRSSPSSAAPRCRPRSTCSRTSPARSTRW